MHTSAVNVSKPCEITADDLHDAYVFCRFRRLGIGMARVLESPHLFKALKNTAVAMKKKKQQNDSDASQPSNHIRENSMPDITDFTELQRERLFQMAKQIANAASFFDGSNPAHLCPECRDAIHHVEILHDIAERLAGERVNEIYAPGDSDEVIQSVARSCGCDTGENERLCPHLNVNLDGICQVCGVEVDALRLHSGNY